MSRFRVYILPFKNENEYADDYVEVTRDVVGLAPISFQLDQTDYGLGVFRNTNFNLKLKNDDGKYGGVDTIKSIFRFKRAGVKIRITYNESDDDGLCGFLVCGEDLLVEETTFFEGLLTEVTSSSNIQDQQVEFKILGYESVLDTTEVPFSDINVGDLISELIFKCLNQDPITSLLTVDALNINPAIDVTLDLIDDLENKTVKEALSNLLFCANSVLYIRDNTVYVTSRAASASLEFSFYGQASIRGIENVIAVKNYREGLNRTYNLWTWQNTSFVARDLTSIQQHGAIKKEIKSDFIDDASSTKIQTMLDSNRDEFAFPQLEMEIDTPLTYETLALGLLDKVMVDYPTVYTPADNNLLPRYGQNVYGGARYPFSQWSLKISSTARFKVLSKKIDPVKQIITFGIRGV